MAVDFSCLKKIKNQFVFRILGCTLETLLILWANIRKSPEDLGSTLGQLRKTSEIFFFSRCEVKVNTGSQFGGIGVNLKGRRNHRFFLGGGSGLAR